MKFLKNSVVLTALTLCYLHSPAQNPAVPLNEPNYNKPKLFSDLPERLNLSLTELESLLDLSVGAQVKTIVAPGLPLAGTVVSKSNPSDASVKTIVIRISTRQGATFTFSRIKKQDGTFSYTGRMMGKGAGDALEIVKEGAGYIIRKKGFYDLVNE